MRDRRALGCLVLGLILILGACSSGESTDGSPPTSAQDDPEKDHRDDPPPPICPLSGKRPSDRATLERPAVAVKVENNPVAYPLSGLQEAEVVYEEVVEGGITRFMALYHCTDASTIGPVRSTRIVDGPIVRPITRLLAAAGGNAIVRRHLRKDQVIILDELNSGDAMRRVDRGSVSIEHTLYGDSKKLRALGEKRFDNPPPQDLFTFGDPEGKGRRMREVSLRFSNATTVTYTWRKGRWMRFDDGRPLLDPSGKQIGVDNVLVERHEVNYSKHVADIAGNFSIEIADTTGRGQALLLRDGRAYRGRWVRKTEKEPVRFRTQSGEPLSLRPGTTWVELLPNGKGEIKGSITLRRR